MTLNDSERDELRAAFAHVRGELESAFEPIVLPILRWLDRQLRRSPRLYAWLSR